MRVRVNIPLANDLHRLSQTEFKRFPASSGGGGAPVPSVACGVLEGELDGDWTTNSRVGPFVGTTNGKFYGVFRAPLNVKALIVVGSSDFGETWTIVAVTATLANTIASHDAGTNGTIIFIGTQEATSGRVAFWVFDMATETFLQSNTQVVATSGLSVNHVGACVSVAERTNGNLGICYSDSENTASFGNRARIKFKESADGGATFGAAIAIGETGDAKDANLCRLVRCAGSRFQVFWTFNFDIAAAEWHCQTMRSNNTLSAIGHWGNYSLSSGPVLMMGDYCTFNSDGNLLMPLKLAGAATYATFTVSNSITAADTVANVANGPTITEGNGGTGNPNLAFRNVNGSFQAFALSLNLVADTNCWVKTGNDPSAFAPNNSALEFGPLLPPSPSNTQQTGYQALIYGGVTYVAEFIKVTVPSAILFDLSRIDLLPSAAETVNEFVTRCAST
jgi:hypothetical protein